MNNTELIELVEAVDNINADLYNQCTSKDGHGHDQTDPWVWLQIEYGAGGEIVVKFLGECLYNNSRDERKWKLVDVFPSTGVVEKERRYESMEPFLRRSVNELIGKLQKIKL